MVKIKKTTDYKKLIAVATTIATISLGIGKLRHDILLEKSKKENEIANELNARLQKIENDIVLINNSLILVNDMTLRRKETVRKIFDKIETLNSEVHKLEVSLARKTK